MSTKVASLNRNQAPRALRNLLAILLISLAGCSDYWWTRGQPPSGEELFSRSLSKLEQAREDHGDARPNIAAISKHLEALLKENVKIAKDTPGQSLAASLKRTEQQFLSLEGKVSVGSRAALGELSGQLRSLREAASSGKHPSQPAVELFASRTLSFLANELSVPAPTA